MDLHCPPHPTTNLIMVLEVSNLLVDKDIADWPPLVPKCFASPANSISKSTDPILLGSITFIGYFFFLGESHFPTSNQHDFVNLGMMDHTHLCRLPLVMGHDVPSPLSGQLFDFISSSKELGVSCMLFIYELWTFHKVNFYWQKWSYGLKRKFM